MLVEKVGPVALLRGATHGIIWGAGGIQTGWCIGSGSRDIRQSQAPSDTRQGNKRDSADRTLDLLVFFRQIWVFWSKFRYSRRKEALLSLFTVMRRGIIWSGLSSLARVNRRGKGLSYCSAFTLLWCYARFCASKSSWKFCRDWFLCVWWHWDVWVKLHRTRAGTRRRRCSRFLNSVAVARIGENVQWSPMGDRAFS